MAGISEIYTAKAMLDSQMVHMGKQGEKLNQYNHDGSVYQFKRKHSHKRPRAGYESGLSGLQIAAGDKT